jgi:arginyl-tRNA synthetase
MASLRTRLSQTFSKAFVDLGYEAQAGDVTLADRPDLAQFQCNGALAQAKKLKKNPREVATAVVAKVQELDPELTLSIAGPGFINVHLPDARLAHEADAMARDSRLGVARVAQPRKVVVDYGGPNVAKTMHVGHLRSSIIGDALVKLYRFAGDDVLGDNHIGDWGTPMGMCIRELAREKPELPYFKDGEKGPFPKESPVTIEDLERIYPVAAKRFKEDEAFAAECLKATDQLQKGTHAGYRALWQHFFDTTIREMNRDFGELGIQFDV